MAQVQALAGSAELIAALPLAQLSVVLFTALWSRDSGAALAALDRVAASFPPPAQPPHIAFYTVPLPIAEVHAAPPPPPPPRARAFWRGPAAARDAERAAFNATHQLPWFPALRAFAGPNTGGAQPGPPPFTYGDSYTAPAMRKFVLDVAHRVVADRERREVACAPPLRARISAVPSTPAPPLAHQCASAQSTAAPPPPLAAPGTCAARARSSLTDLLPRAGDPVELSPDGFTKLLFPPSAAGADAAVRGAVIIVPGGAEAVVSRHRGLWRTVAAAVESENKRGSRRWVVTVLDSARYAEFPRRYGVAPTFASPALLLLDAVADNAHVASTPPPTAAAAAQLLESFAAAAPGELGAPPPLSAVDAAADRAARTPDLAASEAVELVRAEALEGVVAAAAARGPVWVVVHQPWCGFSQRTMAVFRAFAAVAPAGVRVLEVSDADSLPADVDVLVDGFPTVLTVGVGNGSCENGKCQYSEYTGEQSVGELLRLVRGSAPSAAG